MDLYTWKAQLDHGVYYYLSVVSFDVATARQYALKKIEGCTLSFPRPFGIPGDNLTMWGELKEDILNGEPLVTVDLQPGTVMELGL